MARRAQGWRKIDEIEGPNKEKVEIRCNLETGLFMAEIPNPDNPHRSLEKFEGKNLGKVKEEALEWLKNNDSLTWEAILVIRGATRWHGVRESSDSDLNLHYQRGFRSKRPDGVFLWKHFSKDGEEEASEDDVKGVPGKTMHGGLDGNDDALVLPYTPERWSALRMISLLIKQLNERIHALLDQGKFDDALSAIAQRGSAFLLSGPKEKETVKAK